MKKANVINLIKYHAENNDASFKNEAYEIARYFDKNGDTQLSEYIMALLSDVSTFVPQVNESQLQFLKKVSTSNTSLPLPKKIENDVIGIINAIGHNVGINKFLFEGFPGTGKTETVKHIARIMEKELYSVEFSSIIDSKLGQTSKNITKLFDDINSLSRQGKVIVLFDEIDSIAMDRINSNDLREMGRATSAILKGLDELSDRIVLIATTNLYKEFDKALARRFNSVINFNRYEKNDLLDIAESILNNLLKKFKFAAKNTNLFRKIISLYEKIPYPGELKNLIQTCLAFSNLNSEFDYLKRLFETIIVDEKQFGIDSLNKLGFTVREIEILTGISKSGVSRQLNV
jgi:SpoVK/Ycf46/Vps4 family AAA+-type ATPase